MKGPPFPTDSGGTLLPWWDPFIMVHLPTILGSLPRCWNARAQSQVQAHRGPGQQDKDREVVGVAFGGTNALFFPPAADEYLREGEAGIHQLHGGIGSSTCRHSSIQAYSPAAWGRVAMVTLVCTTLALSHSLRENSSTK